MDFKIIWAECSFSSLKEDCCLDVFLIDIATVIYYFIRVLVVLVLLINIYSRYFKFGETISYCHSH